MVNKTKSRYRFPLKRVISRCRFPLKINIHTVLSFVALYSIPRLIIILTTLR